MLSLRVGKGAKKSAIITALVKDWRAAIGTIENVINKPASLGSMWPSHAIMVTVYFPFVNQNPGKNGS